MRPLKTSSALKSGRLEETNMFRTLFFVLALTLTACGGGRDSLNSVAGDDNASIIKVLSNRADLISEGDALVEVLPQGVDKDFSLMPNGTDVSEQVRLRKNGRIMGVVKGLTLGENTLTVSGGVGRRKTPGHG